MSPEAHARHELWNSILAAIDARRSTGGQLSELASELKQDKDTLRRAMKQMRSAGLIEFEPENQRWWRRIVRSS